MAERGRRARGGARAPRPRRLLQLRLGSVRRARRATSSRRTSRVSAHFDDVETPLRLPDPSPRLPLGGPARRHDARRHARRADRARRRRQRRRLRRRRRLGRGARAPARRRDARSGARGSRPPRSDRRSSGRAWSSRSGASPIPRRACAAAARPRPRRRGSSTSGSACASAIERHGLAATARRLLDSRRRVPLAQVGAAALGYPRPPWRRLPQPARRARRPVAAPAAQPRGSSA